MESLIFKINPSKEINNSVYWYPGPFRSGCLMFTQTKEAEKSDHYGIFFTSVDWTERAER